MAIIKRLTKDEIKNNFTHYGYFYGFVPIYISNPSPEGTKIAVRNWIPECSLSAAELFFDFITWSIQLVNPEFEPLFFFTITDKINKD